MREENLDLAMADRVAIVVRPKQPYVDWANSFRGGVPLTIEEARKHRTVYLVPERGGTGNVAAMLERYCGAIFEYELAAWMEDEDAWPDDLGSGTFRRWFDADIVDSVVDLGGEDLEEEDELDQDDDDEDEEEDEDDGEFEEEEEGEDEGEEWEEEASGVLKHCAWCSRIIADEVGVSAVTVRVSDRSPFEAFEGGAVDLPLPGGRSVRALVSIAGSEAQQSGQDLLLVVCSDTCGDQLASALDSLNR